MNFRSSRLFFLILLLVIIGALSCVTSYPPHVRGVNVSGWWKGNLHTHSLWSDGDDYPEMIVEWYKKHGYNFLALSDHNVMLDVEKWTSASTNRSGVKGFEKYLQRFGANWVTTRMENGDTKVRLKKLEEFREMFEETGHFLLIPGEEISDRYASKPFANGDTNHHIIPIHLNATNLRELIRPQGGGTVSEVIQNDINAVLEQRKRTGQPMIPHINHPNFVWAITAEDIMKIQGDRFLEIYNGHPVTKNYGDSTHASTERIWDIVLTFRLAEFGLPPIWGTAVDDSHAYHAFNSSKSNPGRGWLMVRAPKLTPDSLIAAMETGDFYASSGVILRDVKREGKTLSLQIEPETNVTYKVQFIGTRKNFDRSSTPVKDKLGRPVNSTRRYSKDIGAVLAEIKGISASYTLKGDEIYVRAKITSSKLKENPTERGDYETAWTQPLTP